MVVAVVFVDVDDVARLSEERVRLRGSVGPTVGVSLLLAKVSVGPIVGVSLLPSCVHFALKTGFILQMKKKRENEQQNYRTTE